MSAVSVKELFRKNVYELNKPRQLIREFAIVLSDDALTNPSSESTIFNTSGIPDIGATHPTYTGYRATKITYTEGHGGSPYHIHVSVEYGVITANALLHPTSRAAVWNFDSGPGEVPALAYYAGSGNATLRPLTNSAYDYFQGLVTQESTVIAKVAQNFSTFPSTWLAAQNSVNNATYLGCPPHSVKVQKITVEQTSEEFGGGIVRYWAATAELHYRQSGHNLQLPDVGFNFLIGDGKYRCMVFDEKNAEWVPSPGPVGLNGSGAQTFGFPAILNRRVNPEVNFTSIFGAPPSLPLGL